MKNKFKKLTGFATIEILIASTVVSVALIALTLATQKAVDLSTVAVEKVQAGFLLTEGAEAIKLIRDNNWTTILALSENTNYYFSWSGSSWTITTTPVASISGFTRSFVVNDVYRNGSDDIDPDDSGTIDPDVNLIIISVSWVKGGATFTETLPFYVTNLFN